MTAVPNPQDESGRIDLLFRQAQQAAQEGQHSKAQQCWSSVLAINPRHIATLQAMGQFALARRDFAAARHSFAALALIDGGNSQPWIHLAMACRAQKDLAGEIDALRHALTADPHDLMALILRANLLERQGLKHEAAQAYQAVVAVAPALDKLVPDLRPALQHAVDFRDRYQAQFGDFVDKSIADQGAGMSGAELDRFRLSLDIEFGRKKRYESRPMGYFFPGLPTIEFFERSDFPWLDQIEAATDEIRDEFLAVLDREEGFSPYITYGSDQPVNQWAELNNSPRWSAFHLLKDGRPVPGNSADCPLTMQALSGAPQPEQAGRTPVAMFSLLKPRTRIPPHVGISNARLVTHLPLIIPESCGFRVGNQTRQWLPGKAWVFDDTIEHEAWNDSDKLRVVLIFDIWHPHLTPAERRLVSAMTIARNEFLGTAGEFDL